MKNGYIVVSVATLWTSPVHPRKIDSIALSHSVHIPTWLNQMTTEERIWLINQNAVQTQVLYGTRIKILKQQDEWCYCLVPDQYTPKNEIGYPGWIPAKQIGFDPIFDQKYDSESIVSVMANEAVLTTETKTLLTSYLTQLPLQKQTKDKVYVYLPTDLIGYFRQEDITVGSLNLLQANEKGEKIVKTAKQFLGVPYLWSGMSSFAYDCSGLTYTVHKSCGILIPRDASAQYQVGKEKGLEIQRHELRSGDLMYFCQETGLIDHVGLYAGDGLMLHASNSNFHVKIEPLLESKYAERFCGAIRFW
ncbi:MAG TPA: C40 family peptidase [Bacillota bacterium]|nr:C40 family peptidase [Bacillota bacterium]